MEALEREREFPIERLENTLIDHGLEASVVFEDEACVINCEGLHMLRVAIVNDELVIDYIEKDSFEDDVHSKIIGALKTFADEYGYTVRASNVLANARNFWFRMGFVEEVSDFVYEGDL